MKQSLFFTFIVLIGLLTISACKDKQWAGQESIKRVETTSKPIQKQWKGIFEMGNATYASNDFNGARLNGIIRNNDTLITALITPENTPINESPWYAFKLWAEEEQEIYLRITYPEGIKHRYLPKISHDGSYWESVDSINYFESWYKETEQEESESPDYITVKISIKPDTLWISAQELIPSEQTYEWNMNLAEKPFVLKEEIGNSTDGRPIEMLKIGESNDQKMIIVLSRQHPPEVTGYLCMQSFVESLCGDSDLAKKFRKKYNTYVIPMVNPDGVDKGHWRHNSGGIDLNRDWENFNQPEPKLIKEFMNKKVKEQNGKFYVALDFHSTFEDIYYTVDPTLKGNMPGIIPELIQKTATKLPDYEPNIRPSSKDAPISTLFYMFDGFGAETAIIELGDNTSRDFLKLKGAKMAETLMELLSEE